MSGLFYLLVFDFLMVTFCRLKQWSPLVLYTAHYHAMLVYDHIDRSANTKRLASQYIASVHC